MVMSLMNIDGQSQKNKSYGEHCYKIFFYNLNGMYQKNKTNVIYFILSSWLSFWYFFWKSVIVKYTQHFSEIPDQRHCPSRFLKEIVVTISLNWMIVERILKRMYVKQSVWKDAKYSIFGINETEFLIPSFFL